MRRPTPQDSLMAWHRAAIAGGSPPVHPNDPQQGWFRRRLVKGGPMVPARIWLHQEIDEATGELAEDEVWRCEVMGEARDPVDEWPWLCARPISEAEYDHLMRLRQWAGWHEQTAEPLYDPRRPMDPLKTPLPF